MAKAAARETKPGNEYDERRESLVVERKTVFPRDLAISAGQRDRCAAMLHAHPKEAKILSYVRCPTGMIRQITVTAEDLARIGNE